MKSRERKMEDIAVAIKYQFGKEGEIPKVLASGRGLLAKKIIEIARDSDVPVEEQPELANALAKVPVGVEIPPELWEAMAEVLAQIFMLDGRQTHD